MTHRVPLGPLHSTRSDLQLALPEGALLGGRAIRGIPLSNLPPPHRFEPITPSRLHRPERVLYSLFACFSLPPSILPFPHLLHQHYPSLFLCLVGPGRSAQCHHLYWLAFTRCTPLPTISAGMSGEVGWEGERGREGDGKGKSAVVKPLPTHSIHIVHPSLTSQCVQRAEGGGGGRGGGVNRYAL